MLGAFEPIAADVDAALGGTAYAAALAAARSTIDQPERLPAARVLEAMARDFDQSYTAFVNAQSASAKAALMALPYGSDLTARFEAAAFESLQAQQRIEAGDTLNFEDYRQQYLAPERLGI